MAILFLFLGAVLNFFAYFAFATGYTWDKYGNRVTGGMATFNAYGMSCAAIICYIGAVHMTTLALGSYFVLRALIWIVAAGGLGFFTVFFFLKMQAAPPAHTKKRKKKRKKAKGIPVAVKTFTLGGLAIISIIMAMFNFMFVLSGYGKNPSRRTVSITSSSNSPQTTRRTSRSSPRSFSSSATESRPFSDEPQSGDEAVGIFGNTKPIVVVPVQPEKPEVAEITLPELTFKKARAKRTDYFGYPFGDHDFSDDSVNPGGVVVGFVIGESSETHKGIQHIQVIYQVNEKYVYGDIHGREGGREHVVIAKPGYLLKEILMTSTIDVESIQCVFARFDSATGSVSKTDVYDSKIVGTTRGHRTRIAGLGSYVVGIFGKYGDGISGLGLKSIQATQPQTPMSSSSSSTSSVSRTWTSKNGSFTFDAVLEAVEGDVAVLTNDEKTVRVPIEKLSDVDQEWIIFRPNK